MAAFLASPKRITSTFLFFTFNLHPPVSSKNPIGIFDSGVGGLTVANAIVRSLPNEEIIYFGDTAHLPYGDKSADAIRYFSLRISKFLLEQDCKMIVVACNSASSAAYHVLVDFFKGQALFVNVVDPLVEKVAGKRYRKVGVIATKATVQSGMYERQLRALQPDLEIASLATPLLAPMIEEGYVHNEISHAVLQSYLSHPSLQGIDALLLACTHYPLIRPDIEAFFEGKVEIFDSTDVVVSAVRQRLGSKNLLNEQKPQRPHRFYVSDYTSSFESTTRLFYKEEIALEHCPIW
ncbi:MAG: glutamate racemase [Saprospirales bacterium]|nr:glutamate racemase [Saprospirales bacterium]